MVKKKVPRVGGRTLGGGQPAQSCGQDGAVWYGEGEVWPAGNDKWLARGDAKWGSAFPGGETIHSGGWLE